MPNSSSGCLKDTDMYINGLVFGRIKGLIVVVVQHYRFICLDSTLLSISIVSCFVSSLELY